MGSLGLGGARTGSDQITVDLLKPNDAGTIERFREGQMKGGIPHGNHQGKAVTGKL